MLVTVDFKVRAARTINGIIGQREVRESYLKTTGTCEECCFIQAEIRASEIFPPSQGWTIRLTPILTIQ